MYKTATCGVKFDFKKLYHEIDLALEEYQYYGFSLPLIEGQKTLILCEPHPATWLYEGTVYSAQPYETAKC